jgi:hypothetical protein
MKALVVAALALTLAPPARAVDLGTMTGRWPAAATQRVLIEFPAGHLTVQSGAGPDVRASLSVRCRHAGRHCYDAASRIRLVTDLKAGTRSFRLEPRHWKANGLHMDLVIELPPGMDVRTDMGAGELEVDDLAGAMDLNLGAGQATVRMRDRAVRSVDASVGVGEASLVRQGSRVSGHGFLSKRLHWADGEGDARVRVNLGVGEVAFRLD